MISNRLKAALLIARMTHDETESHVDNLKEFELFFASLHGDDALEFTRAEFAMLNQVNSELTLASTHDFNTCRTDSEFARHPKWLATRQAASNALQALRRHYFTCLSSSIDSNSYSVTTRPLLEVELNKIQSEFELKIPDGPMASLFARNERAKERYLSHLRSKQAHNKRLLDDGTAIVHTCRSNRVVRTLPAQGEGDSFFFELANQQVACVCHINRHLINWPNDYFQFITTSLPSQFWWVNGHGNEVEPIATIKGTHRLWESIPGRFAVFPGELPTLEEDLKRHTDGRKKMRDELNEGN